MPSVVLAADSGEELFEDLAAGAAQGQRLAAVEIDVVAAVAARAHLAHVGGIHDRGAVDPEEALGVELALERGERPRQEVLAVLGVDAAVLARALDPGDVADLEREHAATH